MYVPRGTHYLSADHDNGLRVTPDLNGDFSFPGVLTGTFELWIEGGAMNPVHTPIHIEPTAADSSLEIKVAYGKDCSAVGAK